MLEPFSTANNLIQTSALLPFACYLDKKISRNRFEKMVWAGGELNYANGRPEPNQTAGSRVKTQAPDSWTPTCQHQGPTISGEGRGLYQRPPGLYTYRQAETTITWRPSRYSKRTNHSPRTPPATFHRPPIAAVFRSHTKSPSRR
jgi:hypothetical protein